MEKTAVDFLSEFSGYIISKNYNDAYQMFTAGLKKDISKEKFQEAIEENLMETNKAWDIQELIYPGDFEVGHGTLEYTDFENWESIEHYSLFQSSKKLPYDVTKDNFRYWAHIAFLVSEEQSKTLEFDGWFDFWCILVEINNHYMIGYFEITELD
jgi:hypothetical protein